MKILKKTKKNDEKIVSLDKNEKICYNIQRKYKTMQSMELEYGYERELRFAVAMRELF